MIALLIIVDHLRRSFARLDLCAHFLQARSKSFNLLLLLGYGRFLLLHFAVVVLDFAVFFEKLVQQHRVHGVVTDGVDLTVSVAHDQVRVARNQDPQRSA